MKGAVSIYPKEDLQRLYASRYHGAGNIKGVDYQIVVAVDCALRVLRGEAEQIGLEGLEDIDVISEPPVFVQAKAGQLTWTVFADALTNFAAVQVHEPESIFEFVAAQKLTRDLRNLRDLCNGVELQKLDRLRLIKRIEKSCPQIDADKLIRDGQLIIRCVTREELWGAVVSEAVEMFRTSVQSAPLYLMYMASQILEWSASRTLVSRLMLEDLLDETKTAIAMDSTGYEALTSGYVEELTWRPDEAADDFLDGKDVRPGHIVLDLDVPRPRWQREIKEALQDAKVCVVRAPSGQGKSTIMYRYAYSHFPIGETYRLRWVEAREPEQVEAVRQFLETKFRLGQKIHLVIDGGDWRTSGWPSIAKTCVALGFPVLAAIRNEDFRRFGSRIGFRIADITPELTLDEARDVHAYLESMGRLHPSAPSAEVAFELLATPKLLMEFIYLLTHGQAIEDRLAEQLDALESGERPEQITVLRLVAMAHALGVPLSISRVCDLPELENEPRRVFNWLLDEYLIAESGRAWGLHWVRSDHIGRLLHGELRNPVSTVLEVLHLLEDEHVENAIEEAFMRSDVNRYDLASELTSWISDNPERLLLALNAAFAATTRQYASDAASVFHEAFEYAGMSGVEMLAIGAFVTGDDVLESLASSVPNQGLEILLDLRERLPGPKHFDIVAHIISGCIDRGDLRSCLELASAAEIGEILDWLAMSGSSVPDWAVDAVLDQTSIDELSVDELATLCQGCARYDESSFTGWLERTPEVMQRLALEIDAMSFKVEDKVLEFKFLLTPDLNLEDINGEAVRRLELMRRALPGMSEYHCQPVSVLHYPRIPGVRNLEGAAIKSIPGDRLVLQSEVQKNVLVREAAQELFRARTIFECATQWCDVRTGTERLLQDYSTRLNNPWKRGSVEMAGVDGLLLRLRPPPSDSPAKLLAALESAKVWAEEVEQFIAAVTGDNTAPERAVDSLAKAQSKLPHLRSFFEVATQLTEGFECMVDPSEEDATYTALRRVITSLVPEAAPRQPVPKALQSELRENGFVPGDRLCRIDGITYLAVTRNFPDLSTIDADMPNAVSKLPNSDHVDCYFVMPTCGGKAVFPVAFQVWRSADREVEGYIGLPSEMPEEVEETLHDLEHDVPAEFFESQMLIAIEQAAMTGKNWSDASTPASDDTDDYSEALFTRQRRRLATWCREACQELEGLLKSVSWELPEEITFELSTTIEHVAAHRFDVALRRIGIEEPQ